MFAFDRFPATLKYQENRLDAPLQTVEVFGYLNITGKTTLVIFRLKSSSLFEATGGVQLLPASEFEEQFKHFTLEPS